MAGNYDQYTETVIAFAPRSVVLEGFHTCEMQSVVCFMIRIIVTGDTIILELRNVRACS